MYLLRHQESLEQIYEQNEYNTEAIFTPEIQMSIGDILIQWWYSIL